MFPDLSNLSAFLFLYLLAKSVLLAKSMLLAKPFVYGMPPATAFFKSNFVNAKSLEPGVIYRGRIVSVGPHTFENGETALVIRLDYLGKAIPLNKTRLEAMLPLGVDYDTWVSQEITFWRGTTMYQGDPNTPCVVVKPIIHDRINSSMQARPALGQEQAPRQRQTIDELARRARDIRSKLHAWDPGEPPAPDPDDPGPEQTSPDIEDDGIPWS
jgi:hypothetical protein